MSTEEIRELENRMAQLGARLARLRAEATPVEVPDYRFATQDGEVDMSALFGERDHLLMIHNMGQGCRYCTLWADGFNGLLPHLEAALAVVLASGDAPADQRRFAAARNWRFRMVSHADSRYLAEQGVGAPGDADADPGNWPGAVVYTREGDRILRRNSTVFGPGDQFCALWPLLAMAGIGVDGFTPQYRYWSLPDTLLDGGTDLRD